MCHQLDDVKELITYANRHSREIGDTVANFPEDSQGDDNNKSQRQRPIRRGTGWV
jgi:hypothetical protein